MRSSRRALGLGLLAAAAYVAAAALSGHLSLTARGPLLDGFAPPPAYRWVSPPPGASSTEAPAAGRFKVDLDPQIGSLANVFSTADGQASVALAQGAFPPSPDDSSVTLVMTPLAPTGGLTVPPGFRLVGNVVRIEASYRPSGGPAPLRSSAQLVLAYPAPPNAFTYSHVVMSSPDGRTWTRVGGTDSIGQQLVQANVTGLGLFAIGESTGSTGVRKRSPWHVVYPILLGLMVAGIIAVIVMAEIRIRRGRKPAGRSRGPRRPKPPRRPPPPRRRVDPWEDG